jgi:hypothetical protein
MTWSEYAEAIGRIKDEECPYREGNYVSDTTGLTGYWAEYKLAKELVLCI